MKQFQQSILCFRKEFLLLLLLLTGIAAHAQFKPASVHEYTYPPPIPGVVGATANTSCYSLNTQWTGTPSEWLLVSSWDDGAGATAGFSWQCYDPGSGSILDQGYYNYPSGAQDLNVAIINTSLGGTGVQVDVSYYRNGIGHFYDLYNWQIPVALGGPGGGCTPYSTTQLSAIGYHTRISMDAHNSYGIGIVWQDPVNGGISVIAANQNSFGPRFTLNSTSGYGQPDVAFTHAGGPPALHIASYDPYIGILECSVDWTSIIPGGTYAMGCPLPPPFSTCSLPNTVEDINPIPFYDGDIHLHIDAPDHYDLANWAYTYTNNRDVFTRIMNYRPGGPPMIAYGGTAATVNLTNGSYPNPPFLPIINSSGNGMPTIGWDNNESFGNASFYVGWETRFNDPGYNPTNPAYISIQLSENGSIVNPTMPFNFMGVIDNPTMMGQTPSVSFSRQNDRSPFLYTIFSQYMSPTNEIQNKYVPWSIGNFKHNPNATGLAEIENTDEISVYPNPFNSKLNLNVPSSLENEDIEIKVSDLLGRIVGTYSNKVSGANAYLSSLSSTMTPGNYFLDVSVKTSNYQKVFKITKLN